jgi:hypothetical protein
MMRGGDKLREQGVGSSKLPAPTNKINDLAISDFSGAPDIAPETKSSSAYRLLKSVRGNISQYSCSLRPSQKRWMVT